jgi:hypothetical protein
MRNSQNPLRVNIQRLRSYLKTHPATPFVIASQLLMGSAAILVVYGNLSDANQLGMYAFILITITVAVLLVRVMKSSAKPCQTGG